jgi:hypothetical protein
MIRANSSLARLESGTRCQRRTHHPVCLHETRSHPRITVIKIKHAISRCARFARRSLKYMHARFSSPTARTCRVEPAAQYEPSLHGTEAVLDAGQYVPGSHITCKAAVMHTLPAAHGARLGADVPARQ